jgi:hypothetical protein
MSGSKPGKRRTSKQALASKKGRFSRSKGQRGEWELRDLWRVIAPEAERGIGQARSGGEVPDVNKVPDVWIEGKLYAKHPPLSRALEKAIADNKGRRPLVVACGRRDRGAWAAALPLADLLELLKERQELKRLRAHLERLKDRLG